MEPITLTIPTLPLMIFMCAVGIGLTISAVNDEIHEYKRRERFMYLHTILNQWRNQP